MAEGEADFRRRQFNDDFGARILDQLLHFGHSFARHDNARHAGRACRSRHFDTGQTMAIGCHRPQHGVATDIGRVHENAVEIIAGLFGRNRKLRLFDQLFQIARGKRKLVGEIARIEIGKITFGQTLQIEARAPRAQQILAIVAGAFERHLRTIGQFAHDLIEHMGGQRGCARLSDIGRDAFCHFQIQIGGFEL